MNADPRAAAFNWQSLKLRRWTPLSTFASSPVHVTRGLFHVDEGVYATTNTAMGGSATDPGVGAILWAMSAPVALLVYDKVLPSGYEAEFAPPPDGVLGVESLSYWGVLEHSRGSGVELVRSATYRFPDGVFTTSEVVVGSRTFFFREANPSDGDAPIAVRFDLPLE